MGFIKSYVQKHMQKERPAFVVTFEVVLLIAFVVMAIVYLVYCSTLYQQKRYFSTVAMNTCIQAARYGGDNSRAYKLEVGTASNISTNANKALERALAPGFNAHITVSDISATTDIVYVTLTYNFKSGNQALDAFTGLGETRTVTCGIPSLVQYGKLLE